LSGSGGYTEQTGKDGRAVPYIVHSGYWVCIGHYTGHWALYRALCSTQGTVHYTGHCVVHRVLGTIQGTVKYTVCIIQGTVYFLCSAVYTLHVKQREVWRMEVILVIRQGITRGYSWLQDTGLDDT